MELGVEHKQESAFNLRTGLQMATPRLRIRKEKAQNCLGPEFSRAVVGLRESLLVLKNNGWNGAETGRRGREEYCFSPSEMGSRVEGREPRASRVPKEQGEKGRRQPLAG